MCIIGILEHERAKEQRVIVEASLEYEYINSKYIDYAKVSEFIVSHLKKEKFKLLEEAIESLSKNLHRKFSNISKLYLKITKPDIIKSCRVSLSENYTFL